MSVSAHEMPKFDEFLGKHIRGADGMSRTAIAAIVVAAGGTVDFTADQVADIVDGNIEMRIERTEVGWRLVAARRPRCEKCGRWEPKERGESL